MNDHPLTKTAVLVHLFMRCPRGKGPIQLAAGRVRNHFYAASLPWLSASQGRVIPIRQFSEYHDEYVQLRDDFYRAVKGNKEPERYECTLIVLPFPTVADFIDEVPELKEFVLSSLDNVSETVTAELEARFVRRIQMLQKALQDGKRFSRSLLDELDAVIVMGLNLEKTISRELLKKLKEADAAILTYPAEEIRRSTSLREELITICGELL